MGRYLPTGGYLGDLQKLDHGVLLSSGVSPLRSRQLLTDGALEPFAYPVGQRRPGLGGGGSAVSVQRVRGSGSGWSPIVCGGALFRQQICD